MNKITVLSRLCSEIFLLVRGLAGRGVTPAEAFYELGVLGHNMPEWLLEPERIDFERIVRDLRTSAVRDDLGERWQREVRPQLLHFAAQLEEAPA